MPCESLSWACLLNLTQVATGDVHVEVLHEMASGTKADLNCIRTIRYIRAGVVNIFLMRV